MITYYYLLIWYNGKNKTDRQKEIFADIPSVIDFVIDNLIEEVDDAVEEADGLLSDEYEPVLLEFIDKWTYDEEYGRVELSRIIVDSQGVTID